MAEYRLLRRAEHPPVDLWTEVFGVEAPFFTTLLGEDDVSVAAFEGATVVSSVHVFMREIRDREGRPQKVGGIGSVSTHPRHRKQGHSGRLLTMALEAMAHEGCVWSLLGTGVNDHYARYGWRTVSTPTRSGPPRPGIPSADVRPMELDDATLEAMARLHAATTETQPMATVRSPNAWRSAVRYRLSQARIFGAYEGAELATYLVVRDMGQGARYVEIAGGPQRFRDLMASVAANLVEEGVERIVSDLPTLAPFGDCVTDEATGESRGMMLRPIADRIAWPDLLALYGDPRGRHSELDAF